MVGYKDLIIRCKFGPLSGFSILTYNTDVELGSHGDVSIPRPRVDAHVSRSEWRDKQVFFDRVLIFISWENLRKKSNKVKNN